MHDQRQLFQFLVRLRPKFEALRGQILDRSPLPMLDTALAQLIAEETRLRVLHSSKPSQATVLAAVSTADTSTSSISGLGIYALNTRSRRWFLSSCYSLWSVDYLGSSRSFHWATDWTCHRQVSHL
ncbi:uncharacterized protein LOC109727784 isoform X2 [Ananas comosus]|uniref:Uncharacterized protein LOC109727784 isoform X2 n=1 Tax=Ananas comosus TaxID=4615 RepID=A0A6P5H0D9_ANACO|nr:uncharacterized protein LOC109727784 isoform X2 [Ananas comosus]